MCRMQTLLRTLLLDLSIGPYKCPSVFGSSKDNFRNNSASSLLPASYHVICSSSVLRESDCQYDQNKGQLLKKAAVSKMVKIYPLLKGCGPTHCTCPARKGELPPPPSNSNTPPWFTINANLYLRSTLHMNSVLRSVHESFCTPL